MSDRRTHYVHDFTDREGAVCGAITGYVTEDPHEVTCEDCKAAIA